MKIALFCTILLVVGCIDNSVENADECSSVDESWCEGDQVFRCEWRGVDTSKHLAVIPSTTCNPSSCIESRVQGIESAECIKPTPPNAYVVWAPAWDVGLGQVVDPEEGTLGQICVTGKRTITDASSASNRSPVYPSSSEEVLEELFASDDPTSKTMQFGRVEEVAKFAQQAAIDELSLGFLYAAFGKSIAILFSGEEFEPAEPWSSCAPAYVEQVHLGATVAFGFKLRFRDVDELHAFQAAHPSENLVSLLQQTDKLGDLRNELVGKATLWVSALQYGGETSELGGVVAGASCSVLDLYGCSLLLGSLSDYSREFFGKLTNPTLDDFGGYAPVTAFYRVP